MELLGLIKFGTPALILGIIIFLERIYAKIGNLAEDIKDIKDGMVWKDTYESDRETLEVQIDYNKERILRLEKLTNGRARA